MKKRFLLILSIVICCFYSFAQVPQAFNYQAVARDNNGNELTNRKVSFRICLLQGSTTGSEIYAETHNDSTNQLGVVDLEIGNGTVVTGDFSTIDWSTGIYFLKVEMDETGGTSYREMGTTQLLSVPYALYAKEAEEVDDADADPTNEFQVLSISNDTLYLNNGGYVYLGYYSDTQRLVLNDFYLGITDGNEVELPALWERLGNDIRYDSGRVQIGTLKGDVQLELTDVFGSGGRNLVIGDDAYLTDIDMLNTLGIYGNSDSTLASVKLGADGPVFTGKDGYLGISNTTPATKLDVNGVITATGGNSTNWNTAYNWGDHSLAGYLTGYTETDPVFGASVAGGITQADTATWNDKLDAEVDGSVTNEIQDLSDVLAQGADAGSNNITNLADPVNDQDAATKAYIDQMKAGIFTQIAGGKVTDYDGNSYNTVKIGDQVWMAENLRTTHYANGDPIEKVTDNTDWSNLTTGAYCWYGNDSATYENFYGKLYNWYTVADSRKACPTGWHMPSDAEWTTLETYLGGSTVAGGKMKETGTTQWISPNTGATNESGFTALPGGGRGSSGGFLNIGGCGYWWSSTEDSSANAWDRYVNYNTSAVNRFALDKKSGISVRCLKD
jgi:uncharacterized protein (TIGR02145 family)